MNIYVVTLTLSYDDQLIGTIKSVIGSSKINQHFYFEHIFVSPSNDFSSNKLFLNLDRTKNYKAQHVVDEKKGIYNAFNDALNAITGDGYVIFISSGDELKQGLRLNLESFRQGYEIISMGIELIKGETSIPYYPKLSTLPVNRLPHPGMFTKVSALKKAGGFPIDLGSASDFYLTQKLVLNNARLHIEPKIVSMFHLGGTSSKFESVFSYYKALKRLHYGRLTIFVCMPIKIYSYIKYAFQ